MGTKLQKTVNYGSYQVITDYLAGYQYETKPVAQGGMGFAQLLFYPTPEGYVKALYNSANHPESYQYVYNYTDHLGNLRLSYTWDAAEQQVKTLEENHYYPFGLRHHYYVFVTKDVVLFHPKADQNTLQAAPGEGISLPGGGGSNLNEIIQIPQEEVVYKYKYQGQERQDELDLNWDSFKYRNYDYALGRFMSVDPLAEKYPYNSTYAFSENRVIDNVELEGLEGVDFRMKMIEATHAEEIGLMSAQKYMHGTSLLTQSKNFYNNLSSREQLIYKATLNIFSGSVGSFAAGSYMVGTDGVGAAFGGAVAFNLSMAQVGVGFAQLTDAITYTKSPDNILQSYSTLPGLIAGDAHSLYAKKIDAYSSLATIPLTGGLSLPKNLTESIILGNDISNLIINLPAVFVDGKSSNTQNNTNNSTQPKVKQEEKDKISDLKMNPFNLYFKNDNINIPFIDN